MAFKSCKGSGKNKRCKVHQGRSGQVIGTFSGKDSEKMADKKISALHKRFKPKASARGKTAAKKIRAKRKEEGKKGLPAKKFSPKQPKGRKSGVHRKKK